MISMATELQYWEGPEIRDLTYDEMVAEIESYINMVDNVYDDSPEYYPTARMGLARRGDSDRWELLAFDPLASDPCLDSVYTTTDVVDCIVAEYPDVFRYN